MWMRADTMYVMRKVLHAKARSLRVAVRTGYSDAVGYVRSLRRGIRLDRMKTG